MFGVDLPELVGQPCRQEPHCRSSRRCTSSPARASRRRASKPRLAVCTQRLRSQSVRTPHAQVALDAVVVAGRGRRREIGSPRSLRRPLAACHLSSSRRRRAQRHLGVDRGAAANAAPADQDDRPEARIARREREPERPPEVVGGPGLPAHELLGRVVPAGLEQQHRASASPPARRRRRRRPRPSRRPRPRSARSSPDPHVRPVLRDPHRQRRVEVDLLIRARARSPRARRSRCRTPRPRARGPAGTPASARARASAGSPPAAALRQRVDRARSRASRSARGHPRHQRVDVDDRADPLAPGHDRLAQGLGERAARPGSRLRSSLVIVAATVGRATGPRGKPSSGRIIDCARARAGRTRRRCRGRALAARSRSSPWRSSSCLERLDRLRARALRTAIRSGCTGSG